MKVPGRCLQFPMIILSIVIHSQPGGCQWIPSIGTEKQNSVRKARSIINPVWKGQAVTRLTPCGNTTPSAACETFPPNTCVIIIGKKVDKDSSHLHLKKSTTHPVQEKSYDTVPKDSVVALRNQSIDDTLELRTTFTTTETYQISTQLSPKKIPLNTNGLIKSSTLKQMPLEVLKTVQIYQTSTPEQNTSASNDTPTFSPPTKTDTSSTSVVYTSETDPTTEPLILLGNKIALPTVDSELLEAACSKLSLQQPVLISPVNLLLKLPLSHTQNIKTKSY